MHDAQSKFARERVSENGCIPARCLRTDKNFTVLKRQHIRWPRLIKKLSMQVSHSPVGDEPNENFAQPRQFGAFSLVQCQTTPHRPPRKFLKIDSVNWNSSLDVAHANFRKRRGL